MMSVVKEERKSPCIINCGSSSTFTLNDNSSSSNVAQYYDEATNTNSISISGNINSSSYRIQDTNILNYNQNKSQNLNYKENISISISKNSLSSAISKCPTVSSTALENIKNPSVESEYFQATAQYSRNNISVEPESISKKTIAVYSPDLNTLGSRGITKNDIGKELSTIYPGDISEAVSRILDDYDWSQIPLTNRSAQVHVII